MLKIIMCVGIPGSGKSTWAKSEVAKDPDNWVRINNDDLRAMMNGSVYSAGYEKLVTEIRNSLIKEAIKKDKNIIIDNLNLNKKHFDDVIKLAKSFNKNIEVSEKTFYIDLDEAITRDSQREGKARVGESVIKRWWKDSGKDLFKSYKPRVQVFTKHHSIENIEPITQKDSLPRAVVFDNDGTISLIHPNRSPYDASTCDQDLPHSHVIECMRLYFKAGYKIIFVSGREDKDREPTERFYKQHFPEITYELFMRKTGDKRKDVIIKEEIYINHIADKYYIAGWFDDRLQVCKWVYENGLPLFRVNNPEASF